VRGPHNWSLREVRPTPNGEYVKTPSPTGQIARVNDIEMYYETRGDGEPLVLLHGGGGVGENWELIFKAPPEGYRLVVPDLRGHGRTNNPSMEFTFRQSALDVLALLDHLGIERFKAIGLSMGAKTLLHVATRGPNRVEAMVLVSAAPYFPEQSRAVMRDTTPDNRSAEDWAKMRQWHKHGDEQIRAIWRQARSFADSYDDMNFTPAYLSTITARTLIVHGDRDPLYPVSLAMEMYSAIPRSYLWVIPNGGHGPIFGEHTGTGKTTVCFAETALAFLRDEWVNG
jgi:pimeloyl-ACP methyl ester carboxylesterase